MRRAEDLNGEGLCVTVNKKIILEIGELERRKSIVIVDESCSLLVGLIRVVQHF